MSSPFVPPSPLHLPGTYCGIRPLGVELGCRGEGFARPPPQTQNPVHFVRSLPGPVRTCRSWPVVSKTEVTWLSRFRHDVFAHRGPSLVGSMAKSIHCNNCSYRREQCEHSRVSHEFANGSRKPTRSWRIDNGNDSCQKHRHENDYEPNVIPITGWSQFPYSRFNRHPG
jgi:hypothetical protein